MNTLEINTLEINTLENNVVLSTDYEVVIGCAPFNPRPDVILSLILQNITNLSLNDFNIVSKLYGDWTFIPLKEKENIYIENQDLIGTKLKEMHLSKKIRYAEW